MTWTLVALLVLGAATATWLVWAGRHRREPPDGPDPLFITGIALAGTGAATITTLGPAMLGVLAVGILLMAIGIRRGRVGRGPR
jgi:hypothetical protein